MPDTAAQSQWVVMETAHTPSFSPGPSSPDSVLRPRRLPPPLDEKELTAQLRQVREAGSVWVGPGLSLAPPGVPWRLSVSSLHPGASAEGGRGRQGGVLCWL